MSNVAFTPTEADLFAAATGMKPPQLNTDLTSEAGQILGTLADKVNELTQLVQQRIDAGLLGMSGEMSEAFIQALEQFTTSPPYILPTVSELARELGAYTIATSEQAEAMKIQAIVALTVLIVSFIVDAIIAFFSPQAGAEAAAADPRFPPCTWIPR